MFKSDRIRTVQLIKRFYTYLKFITYYYGLLSLRRDKGRGVGERKGRNFSFFLNSTTVLFLVGKEILYRQTRNGNPRSTVTLATPWSFTDPNVGPRKGKRESRGGTGRRLTPINLRISCQLPYIYSFLLSLTVYHS